MQSPAPRMSAKRDLTALLLARKVGPSGISSLKRGNFDLSGSDRAGRSDVFGLKGPECVWRKITKCTYFRDLAFQGIF